MGNLQELLKYLFDTFKIFVIVQPWESGIRVRAGKKIKKIEEGVHFKVPYLDSIYIQEKRLRIADLPMQTVTSKDLKTLTIDGAIGYIITDVEKLYNTIFQPETTIRNIVMSEVSDYVFSQNLKDITPKSIEKTIVKKLAETEYGIKFEYYKTTNFAVVRTYRLIQDYAWSSEKINMGNQS